MTSSLWALRIVLVIIAACLGASVASFANVAIDRLPRGRSLFWPPSQCAACSARIRPYDNVPILGWLALRGRCRACGRAIGVRSFALEIVGALTGGLVAAAVLTLL